MQMILRTRRHLLVLLAAFVLLPAAPAGARVGALTQLHGKPGCVAQQNNNSAVRRACTPGRFAGGQMWDLAMSPDGRNLYVASVGGAVSVLRIGRGGHLHQLAGRAGCVSATESLGCKKLPLLLHSESIVATRDGRNVYVGVNRGAGGVLAFARNGRTGILRKIGCLGENGKNGCAPLRTPVLRVNDLAVAPDGHSVYLVAGVGSNSPAANRIVVLARGADGKLTELPGAAGCVNGDGSGGCTAARGLLPGCCGIAVSPESGNVYVSSSQFFLQPSPTTFASSKFALAAFSRDAASGALTQLPGTAGCVNQDGSAGCAAAAFAGSLPENTALGIVISPNGRSLYLSHSSTFPGAEAGGCGGSDSFFALFSRDPISGALGTLVQDIGSCGSFPTLSPDGRSLYAATGNFGEVLSVLSRDRQTGSLAHAGCIGLRVFGCKKGRNFTAPSATAVTPDGRYVYAISDDPGTAETIGVFRRSLR